jgi:hypothetical protein
LQGALSLLFLCAVLGSGAILVFFDTCKLNFFHKKKEKKYIKRRPDSHDHEQFQ